MSSQLKTIFGRRQTIRERAAAGKALIVYLGTGSIFAAIVAFVLFKVLGC